MFNQVFSQKQSIHKQQNQLYRIIVFCLVLFSPVLLLLAPLPGYLIYQGTEHFFSHILGWLIITLIGVFEGYLFMSVWQKNELVFFKYLFGKDFNKNLLVSFFQSSFLLHLFIWAGYIKADVSVSNLLLTATIYLYNACIFIVYLKYKLATKTELNITWPNTKIIVHLFLNGNLTSIILLILGSLIFSTFLFNVEKADVILSIASLWLLLNVYLIAQVWRAHKVNLNQYSMFLTSISPKYMKTIKAVATVNWCVIFITVLTLNISIAALQLINH